MSFRHRVQRSFRIRIFGGRPRRALLVTAVALVAALLPAGARASTASSLPSYDITGVYVAGVSSGGFMATQLQVAYSSLFDGAGVFAAGPYDCGQGDVTDFETCDLGVSDPQLEAQAETWASQGLIDPVSGLAGKPVYVYHGTLDPVINTAVSNAGVSFYQHFGANVEYNDTDPAGHAWVTPRGPNACSVTAAPFMNNCGDDPEGQMLQHWLGSVSAPNDGAPEGTLASFDQNDYVPGGNAAALSMGPTGLLYTPSACADGAACKLVVALHGCLSGQYLIGDLFPEDANLDTYADTNNLVVLYPQATAGDLPYNPEGCWDWWGYDGANFAVQSGPEMTAIVNMVHALSR
ncbi:MAG TPA: PHB depolymerase family esterase [Trebonia sp.]|jgi:poly(3-hydroxybutyrate) depolymerase|nr:PHB depolymerase family esterase [Trebonia sp.]